MRTFQRTSLLLLSVLLVTWACVAPAISLIDPSAQATSMAQTVMAMVVETQRTTPGSAVAPSETPNATGTIASPTLSLTPGQTPTQTQTPTPSTTLSPTPTSSPLVIFTPSPLFATLSVSVPTNCRTGPGKVYQLVGALLVGETARIYGRNASATYWYIANPDLPGRYCWVWGQYATVTGPTGGLPIFTPGPTPRPTATDTPTPTFDVSYEGLIGCSGDWWVELKLKNTGVIAFRSIKLVVKDMKTSDSFATVDDGFIDRPTCGTSVTRPVLSPGKGVIVSSAKLADNPTGHKLRATITLCSQTGQDGTCLTEVATFSP